MDRLKLVKGQRTMLTCSDIHFFKCFGLVSTVLISIGGIIVKGKVMGNRKLIRPSLSGLKEPTSSKNKNGQRKRLPPDQTSAEQYYYLKQMSNKTPIVVKLLDGEEVCGVIEWYDRDCIKVNREVEPNLMIPKRVIKYIYKERTLAEAPEKVLLDAANSG